MGSQRTILLFCVLFSLLGSPRAVLGESGDFFYEGNGKPAIIGGSNQTKELSPRLIALLDYLQDRLASGRGKITIYSGYRSPTYNEGLRRKGRSAAKSSLHMEGMAADIGIEGVTPKALWLFVRQLDCCGAGYYAGVSVHVDVGPKRFWEQATSKVFTDISADNKQILAVTEKDFYQTKEILKFRLVRATRYPFGIRPSVEIWMETGEKAGIAPLANAENCLSIPNRRSHQLLRLTIPTQVPQEKKLRLVLSTCDKPSPRMPDRIESNLFVIKRPHK